MLATLEANISLDAFVNLIVAIIFQGDVKDELFDIIEEKFNVDPDFIHDIGTVKR